MAGDTEYDYPTQTNDGRANQSIIIDNGKYIAVVAICAALCGVAAVYAYFAHESAGRSEKRADLLQYYVMELDGKVMQAGIIKPNESWSAQQRAKENE